jgi:anthranilate phosphoribosyltransferase
VSASGITHVVEVDEGEIRTLALRPEDLGLEAVPPDAIVAGAPEENAAVLRTVLGGAPGAARALVLANAGAAVYVAGRAPSLTEGVALAAEAIDSGAAEAVLERYLERTRALAPAA